MSMEEMNAENASDTRVRTGWGFNCDALYVFNIWGAFTEVFIDPLSYFLYVADCLRPIKNYRYLLLGVKRLYVTLMLCGYENIII